MAYCEFKYKKFYNYTFFYICKSEYYEKEAGREFTPPTSAERKAVYPVSWSLLRATFSLVCTAVFHDVTMDGGWVNCLISCWGCVKLWFVTHVWTDPGNRCAKFNHQSIILTTSIPNEYIHLNLTLDNMLLSEWTKVLCL